MDNSQIISQISVHLDNKFKDVQRYFDEKLDKLTGEVDRKFEKLNASLEQQGNRLVVMETQFKLAADDKNRLEKMEQRVRDLEDAKAKAWGVAAVFIVLVPIVNLIINRLI